ncbi:MAG TPA: hypothetical protein VK659_09735 [Asanoa sp.]|nr:hypothetical protein [Asanoa sp.]
MFKRASTETRSELKEARADLERVGKRDRSETDDFIAANRRVIAAEQAARDSRHS